MKKKKWNLGEVRTNRTKFNRIVYVHFQIDKKKKRIFFFVAQNLMKQSPMNLAMEMNVKKKKKNYRKSKMYFVKCVIAVSCQFWHFQIWFKQTYFFFVIKKTKFN